MRFLGPPLVNKAAEKIYEDMQNRAGQRDKGTVRKGDITIRYGDKQPKRYHRTDGDYIDFEEITENK